MIFPRAEKKMRFLNEKILVKLKCYRMSAFLQLEFALLTLLYQDPTARKCIFLTF